MYLVRELEGAGASFAAKKVLCQSAEQLEGAHAEVAAMERFHHPNLLELLAHETVREGRGGRAVVYFLTPAYLEGSLVDFVERVKAGVGGRAGGGGGPGGPCRIPADQVLRIFLQVCDGLRCMHEHDPPFAHRDIKPHNVLVRGAGGPGGWARPGEGAVEAVLMDFGSVREARRTVSSRLEALRLQEEAEAHCTAAYRAPELFDVPSECTVDEKVDIWSLGCCLYYLLRGESPFEYALGSTGGSIALAVLSGKYSWDGPGLCDSGGAEEGALRGLVDACLSQDPTARPSVQELARRCRALLDDDRTGPEDGRDAPSPAPEEVATEPGQRV